MNSTVRSNLTVGPPIDLLIYQKDSLIFKHQLCMTDDDPFAKEVSEAWNKGLISALENLPKFYWETSSTNQVQSESNSVQATN
jgi:putative proteasome-type protease